MNLLNHYPEIVAAYPEYITQKQFCEVCGVCHKTAYNLERRGEIPYKVVDTPTGRIHHIKLIDALAYHIAFSIILLIAVMVIVVDLVTGYLRRELNK